MAFSASGADRASVGHVVSLKGKVSVGGKSLRADSPVFSGDVVKTDQGGSAKLLMIDETILDVGASTALIIKSYVVTGNDREDVLLSLDEGSVRALVNKRIKKKGRFRFRTRSSVLAVRGTEWVSTATADEKNIKDQFTVFEGKVIVVPEDGEDEAIELDEGTQWTALAKVDGDKLIFDSERGEVVTLTTAQLQTILDQAALDDNTFTSYIVVANPEDPNRQQLGRDTLTMVGNSLLAPPDIQIRVRDFFERGATTGAATPTVDRTDVALKVLFKQ